MSFDYTPFSFKSGKMAGKNIGEITDENFLAWVARGSSMPAAWKTAAELRLAKLSNERQARTTTAVYAAPAPVASTTPVVSTAHDAVTSIETAEDFAVVYKEEGGAAYFLTANDAAALAIEAMQGSGSPRLAAHAIEGLEGMAVGPRTSAVLAIWVARLRELAAR